MKSWLNNKYTVTALAAGALLLVSGSSLAVWAERSEREDVSVFLAQAQLGNGDPEFEAAVVKHLLKRFFNRIDASESQRTEISEIVESKRQANRSKRDALKAAMKEFLSSAASLDNSETSNDSLRAKAKVLRTMHEELMDDRLESFLKVRSLLSSEQKEKLHNNCKSFGAFKAFRRGV
ncbi:MAG: Spy/CpxP family protein refolding chaperone [Candidatus Obscuribacterales bacterium]|jgi:Spy/CpxP family protein refolding chaperone